jgi:hypothetical protein
MRRLRAHEARIIVHSPTALSGGSMTRILRGAYDFHGTLVEDMPEKQFTAKQLTGVDIPHQSLRRELAESLIGRDRYERVLEYLYENPVRVLRLKPMVGAPKVLSDLTAEGHQQFVITASGEKAFRAVCKWTKKYRSFLGPPVEIYSVGRHGDKAELIHRLHLDYYIDNKLDVLRQVRRYFEELIQLQKESDGVQPDIRIPILFLLNRPDNQDQDESGIAERVRSLSDLYVFVSALAKLPAP